MSKSGRGLAFILSVVALLAFLPPPWAATTVMDIKLGDTIRGNIRAGVDTVEARFPAAQGTEVRITVRADEGSTLQPTIVIRDSSGAAISSGKTQQIRWLPLRNLIHHFTVPANGIYTAEIGGSAGSGGFWARFQGDRSAAELATISGTVTNSLTLAPVPGVSVTTDGRSLATTGADGRYSASLYPGSYSVSFGASDFTSQVQSVNLAAGASSVLDVALVPLIPVIVEAQVSGDTVAGGTLSATVDIQMAPGTMINSIAWTQEYGAAASIVDGDTATATVTLGAESAYRDELVHVLSEPPVSQDELPPNVVLPPGEFPGGLQNRFQVVGINPFAIEEAGLVVLKVEVDTQFGLVRDEVEVHTALPWKTATGLRNVPLGAPVLLQAKEQASYDWVLVTPPGSLATLTDATTRNPYFTPDVAGQYLLEVTDLGVMPAALLTLEVYAGTWRGTVVDQDIDGRPVADTVCTSCHNDAFAPDKFTPWAQTGHAEIFTANLDTNSRYSSRCFGCHTVGYDTTIDNGGIDEATDYQDFLTNGPLGTTGDNWTQVLADFPETAQLANIQCENCHGPQVSMAHRDGPPRVDISSDVCAVCHGEPLRHARFQQWQLSAHANYEGATGRGSSGNCSRCHTGNGFLKWLPILLDDDPNTDPLASIAVTWTTDEVHPQTCATCHDPHSPGTTSGANTNARVRISGDTPPLIGGFQVLDAGRGAICMTCHNSRRGLRNDSNFDQVVGTAEAARAPHGSAQADVLVGQNAYLLSVPRPGGHAGLEDSCVACHMAATPPPAVLSYNQGGTNHTFFASREICSDCHRSDLTAANVQNNVQKLLDDVQGMIESALIELMAGLIGQGFVIDLNGAATISNINDVDAVEFGESRGRQAITVTLRGAVLGPFRMNDIDVVDPAASPPVLGQLYDFASPGLIKSGWNWGLIHNDGSRGVHNPFFAIESLAVARSALVSPAMRGSGVPLRRADERPRDWWGTREEARTKTRR